MKIILICFILMFMCFGPFVFVWLANTLLGTTIVYNVWSWLGSIALFSVSIWLGKKVK